MRIGKERCERRAYPHTVYPDRNRIRLHVNWASISLNVTENVTTNHNRQYSASVVTHVNSRAR